MNALKDVLASVCTACGSAAVDGTTHVQSVPYLDRNGVRQTVSASVRGCRCTQCGFSWHTPAQLDAITEAVAVAMGSIAPSRVRAARRQRDWSQRDLARAAGIPIRRVRRIEQFRSLSSLGDDLAIRRALGLGDGDRSAVSG